ncbi:hypothetical protein AGMMS50293_10310 [Spirochaetia bacterium]|nr:hypothetical protein AGMMS50293_10310 [Spirochaetia bacterium]
MEISAVPMPSFNSKAATSLSLFDNLYLRKTSAILPEIILSALSALIEKDPGCAANDGCAAKDGCKADDGCAAKDGCKADPGCAANDGCKADDGCGILGYNNLRARNTNATAIISIVAIVNSAVSGSTRFIKGPRNEKNCVR